MTIAQPEDHKSATSFTYRFADGRSVTLPKFSDVMTFGRARKMRGLEESEQMFTLMEEICTEDVLSVLDAMNLDETSAFFTAWQEDSGASVGESEGSST